MASVRLPGNAEGVIRDRNKSRRTFFCGPGSALRLAGMTMGADGRDDDGLGNSAESASAPGGASAFFAWPSPFLMAAMDPTGANRGGTWEKYKKAAERLAAPRPFLYPRLLLISGAVRHERRQCDNGGQDNRSPFPDADVAERCHVKPLSSCYS
jgi:hypothetical protein